MILNIGTKKGIKDWNCEFTKGDQGLIPATTADFSYITICPLKNNNGKSSAAVIVSQIADVFFNLISSLFMLDV